MQYGRYQLRPYEALIRAAHHGSCITRRFEPNTKTTHASLHRSTQHRTWPHSHQAISHLRRQADPNSVSGPRQTPVCNVIYAAPKPLGSGHNQTLNRAGRGHNWRKQTDVSGSSSKERLISSKEVRLSDHDSGMGRTMSLPIAKLRTKKGNVIFGTWPN
jgi:hypothetical protein